MSGLPVDWFIFFSESAKKKNAEFVLLEKGAGKQPQGLSNQFGCAAARHQRYLHAIGEIEYRGGGGFFVF